MNDPYIGITGVVSDADIETIFECARLVNHGYRLMAGVLVSYRSMRGPVASRRYPEADRLAWIFRELAQTPGVWPVVHYNTRNLDAMADEVERVLDLCPDARGVQLNVVAPDRWQVERIARRVPVILQVNRSSLALRDPEEPDLSPGVVGEYVARYPDASHALLDLSGGTGRPLNEYLVIKTLASWQASARVGIAGGLGPQSYETLARLRAAVPGVAFSIDAESALRVPVDDPLPNERHQDRLDRERALAYVRNAMLALP